MSKMVKTQMIKDYESWAKKNKVIADTSASLYGTYLNYLKKDEYFGAKFRTDFECIENFYDNNVTDSFDRTLIHLCIELTHFSTRLQMDERMGNSLR